MKIVVLDLDQAHNQRIRTALVTEAETETSFCQTTQELTDLLNAKQDLEEKKQAMEKTLNDGAAMLARTIAAAENAKIAIVDKRSIQAKMTKISEAADNAKIGLEIDELLKQVAKSEDLKKKLEFAIDAKQKELTALTGQILREEQKKVHLVLVDRSYLGNLPSDWLLELRKKINFTENKEVPVITMAYNEDLDYIKNTLYGGVLDYFVKPVDLLLFKHRLGKIRGDTENAVFELPTQTQIQIFKSAAVTKMSEFDVAVRADSAFQEKEIVEFFADGFGGEKGQRILGMCLKNEPDPNQKGWFLAEFSFVGHTPHTMNEMRKWLRMQYVAQKQREEGT